MGTVAGKSAQREVSTCRGHDGDLRMEEVHGLVCTVPGAKIILLKGIQYTQGDLEDEKWFCIGKASFWLQGKRKASTREFSSYNGGHQNARKLHNS